MKSVTALCLGILLLVGSLFPQTDVEEVFKLPGLVTHYQWHKQIAKGDIDIWQFLEMHYGLSSKHAKTDHEGVKIPLYNHLSAGFVFVLSAPQFVPARLETFLNWPSIHFTYENLYSFLRVAPLLQPPRLG
ncbi:hypothetical protein [Rudanella lutea]|uniref:hypothetical protein n=1 Tax=Rudanella lutea TaxID=451374 RepID=UPI00037F8761|nr:hypothetical protein [Rudanella lutea]